MDETRTTAVRFPPGRYGRRRERKGPSPWLVGSVAAIAVAGGLTISVAMYDQYGRTDFTGNVIAFDTSERSVDITFEVYKPAGEGATCLVRARSADGAEVGHAEVSIPAEESATSVDYTLETSAKPVTGELVRCYPARLDLAHIGVTLEGTGAARYQRSQDATAVPVHLSQHFSPEDAIVSTNQNNTGAWLSQEAHDRLTAELNELIAGRPAMAAEINARREEGDLRENGGYHAAKEEQGKMEARIRYLEDFLRTAQVGEAPSARNVAAGNVVTVAFDDDPDDTQTFLLGSREIAATTDMTVYSPESALGAAILGHAEGDTVTYEAPSGAELKVTITGIATFEG